MADNHAYGYDVFERFTQRWPEAGDRLLSPGRDTFLAESAFERSYRLLRGYKRAGDILVQSALTQRCDRDNLVFPALFNYRHYIELALKAIVEEHGTFAGVALGTKNHKLPEFSSEAPSENAAAISARSSGVTRRAKARSSDRDGDQARAPTFLPVPASAVGQRLADLAFADHRNQLSILELASRAATSVRTVSRLFPAETGLTYKAGADRACNQSAIQGRYCVTGFSRCGVRQHCGVFVRLSASHGPEADRVP